MTKDFWWKNLDEQTQRIRVNINKKFFALLFKWGKITFLTFVFGFSSAFLSLMQPLYVFGKIVHLLSLIVLFESGIILGIILSDTVVVTHEFKKEAQKCRNTKE